MLLALGSPLDIIRTQECFSHFECTRALTLPPNNIYVLQYQILVAVIIYYELRRQPTAAQQTGKGRTAKLSETNSLFEVDNPPQGVERDNRLYWLIEPVMYGRKSRAHYGP